MQSKADPRPTRILTKLPQLACQGKYTPPNSAAHGISPSPGAQRRRTKSPPLQQHGLPPERTQEPQQQKRLCGHCHRTGPAPGAGAPWGPTELSHQLPAAPGTASATLLPGTHIFPRPLTTTCELPTGQEHWRAHRVRTHTERAPPEMVSRCGL